MKKSGLFIAFLAFAAIFCSCKKDVNGNNSSQDVKVEGNTFTINGVPFEMVEVEGGQFMMGDTVDIKHLVTLSSYKIGKTEVTQKLWELVMGNNPSKEIGADLPVHNVTWDECQEFISKLNDMTGYKFRLPTEAEWEYAARGGKKSKGYVFAGSDSINDVAWHFRNSNDIPHAVAKKEPNELGIYDMSGNVREWCNDWFETFGEEPTPETNPQGPASGMKRVVRGGSWDDGSSFITWSSKGDREVELNTYYKDFFVNSRNGREPYSSFIKDIGFRLVLSADK